MGRSSSLSGLTWEGEPHWVMWNEGFVIGIRLSKTMGSGEKLYRSPFALMYLMWPWSCHVCRTAIRELDMKWERIKFNWSLWNSTWLKDKLPWTWGRWRNLCGENWGCRGPGESHVNKVNRQISDNTHKLHLCLLPFTDLQGIKAAASLLPHKTYGNFSH